MRTGAVFETDQGSSVFTCGGSLAPHAELKRDQGDRCCILGTLRVSLPLGDFLQGWGRAGSRINPAPPVGTAGLCLCCAISPWEFAAAAATPAGGCVLLAALPSPTAELQRCLRAALGAFAGNVPHPWEYPFVPEWMDRAAGLVSFRV